MGPATAASVAADLLRRLETDSRRWGLPSTIHEGVTRMERPLLVLHFMLSVASGKQSSFDMMGAVLMEINQVLYEVEDLVGALEGQHASGLGNKGTLFLSPSTLLWHINVAHRIKTISRKLDMLAKACPMVVLLLQTTNSEQRMEPVNFHEAALIGRHNEVKEIKDLLLQNNTETLSILPIVGFPGIGKSSLARLVFNDKGEAWDFDLRIWISFSNVLDLKNIARCIISEANKLVEERFVQVKMNDQKIEDNLEQMKNRIEEILNNNSCLIVLDNLWSTDDGQLEDLKEMLRPKQKCTKVIVTTCSEKVAELMGTVPLYELGCLPEDDSWAIFSEKAFRNGYAIADSQYTKIGKDIVKRCEGIPLLAQSLGSLVHNQGMDTWLAARDEELWKLEACLSPRAKLFTSFKEIYYSMPLALKSCFLYLSVFPKGSNIDKAALIRQWIALDLLGSKHGTIPDYIIGEKYIKDLLSARFLKIHDKTSKQTNAPVTLQMHDFIHEFVRYIARDDLIVLDSGKSLDGGSSKLHFRYAVLSNCCGQSSVHRDLIVRSKAVHFRNCETTVQIADIFSLLGHSRIIDLSRCALVKLPATIGKLKSLRYLALSDSRIKSLPDEVSCLRNLESLDLAKTCIEVIPSFIGSFEKLKYFNLHGCEKLQKLPPTLGCLKKLEHLNLSCCSGIDELPVSLCSLLELRLLDLSGCTKLQELPHQLGNLGRLENLNVSGCSRLKQLPKSLGDIKFLMSLNVAGCCELQEIPVSIQQFSHTRPHGLVFC